MQGLRVFEMQLNLFDPEMQSKVTLAANARSPHCNYCRHRHGTLQRDFLEIRVGASTGINLGTTTEKCSLPVSSG